MPTPFDTDDLRDDGEALEDLPPLDGGDDETPADNGDNGDDELEPCDDNDDDELGDGGETEPLDAFDDVSDEKGDEPPAWPLDDEGIDELEQPPLAGTGDAEAPGVTEADDEFGDEPEPSGDDGGTLGTSDDPSVGLDDLPPMVGDDESDAGDEGPRGASPAECRA